MANCPKIYFAEINPSGSSERTALGYIPKNYELFKNFMPTKLNHADDKGNTYRLDDCYNMVVNTFVLWQSPHGSHYTFQEFYTDMEIIGYEVIYLPPLSIGGGIGGLEKLVKYVEENYIE